MKLLLTLSATAEPLKVFDVEHWQITQRWINENQRPGYRLYNPDRQAYLVFDGVVSWSPVR